MAATLSEYMPTPSEIKIWTVLLAITATFAVFCWYVNPSRVQTPNLAQHVLVRIWLFFRRLVCFCIGGLFLYMAAMALLHLKNITEFGIFLFAAAIGCFSIYVGIFGQGNKRYSFKDDLALHRQVKDKYKIKW